MHRPRTASGATRLSHLASLSWVIEDTSSIPSPLNSSIPYSLSQQTQTPQLSPATPHAKSMTLPSPSSPDQSSTPALSRITDRTTHDAAVDVAASKQSPIVIYVSSAANPVCRYATPQIENLATKLTNVRWFIMEMTVATTPMIKFGPQNTPLFILMDTSDGCETILGGDLQGLERKVLALK